ncbi:MAG: acyl-CoA dehydrogenase family protein [Gaiellaceae bacterium]
MDFSFSEDQLALKSEVRRFLTERFPAERVAELADGAGWDPDSWPELAQLGWLGVSVPEGQGGAGLGFVEEAVIHEEIGYALFPGPYFATVALALPLLAAGEQAEATSGARRWSVEVDGLVPEWGRVDRVLTAAGPVAPEGEALDSVDPTRPLGRLRPTKTGCVGAPPRALAALAAESVGIAQRALELGIEHARAREQFGRPIGVYQAVSHPLATTYMEVELARSLAYWAAWCVAEADPLAPVAAAAAKAQASEAAVAACERSIQVHGGIGFTWEHVLHRYYRRALWIHGFAGTPGRQRAAVAAALLDDGHPAARATEEAAWTA